MKFLALIAAALAVALQSAVAGNAVNPDDVMLRRPSKKTAAAQRAADEAAAHADVERRFQEAKAKAEKAAAEKAAAEKAAAEKAAAEKAAAEKAAAEKARQAAEVQRLQKQIADEQAARAKAEADRKASEAAAKKAEDERRAAAEAQQRAEAERRAAEEVARKAEAERARAVAEKKGLEKRAAYLANPDPDERPQAKKLVAEAAPGDVVAPSVVVQKTGAKKKGAKTTGRAAIITADRTDYDRKEGVILFDRNVFVDDEQYRMHADRLFVFLDGTNDLKRLVALGNVAITNEARTAACAKAVYTKAASRIVMYGDERTPACLSDGGGKKGASTVRGQRITYWLDTGMATVDKPVIEMPAMKGGNSPKDLFKLGSGKGE